MGTEERIEEECVDGKSFSLELLQRSLAYWVSLFALNLNLTTRCRGSCLARVQPVSSIISSANFFFQNLQGWNQLVAPTNSAESGGNNSGMSIKCSLERKHHTTKVV